RVVGVHLLKTVDRRQRLFVFAVFPVDVGQVDQRLLGVHAKRVATFNRGEAVAGVAPHAGIHFGLGVGVQLFGAPTSGLVVFCVGAAATCDSQSDRQRHGQAQEQGAQTETV